MISLTHILVLGLAVFFAVEVVRKLPVISRLTTAGARPFACHLCMSLWLSLGVHLALPAYGLNWVSGVSFLAVGGVSLLLLYVGDALGEAKGFDLPGGS